MICTHLETLYSLKVIDILSKEYIICNECNEKILTNDLLKNKGGKVKC